MNTFEDAQRAISESKHIVNRLRKLSPQLRKTVLQFVQGMLSEPEKVDLPEDPGSNSLVR